MTGMVDSLHGNDDCAPSVDDALNFAASMMRVNAIGSNSPTTGYCGLAKLVHPVRPKLRGNAHALPPRLGFQYRL